MTTDTSTCFSIEVHAPGNQREASLAPTGQPRWTASPLFSPWVSADPSSQQGSTQHRLLLLPLPSSFPTVWTEQSLEASNSAACNPFCSHWWAAQWSSVRMVWNPGDPHAILSPLSHTPVHSGPGPSWAGGQGGGTEGPPAGSFAFLSTPHLGSQANGAGLFHRDASTFWELFLPLRGAP